jgi:hypothetical protein
MKTDRFFAGDFMPDKTMKEETDYRVTFLLISDQPIHLLI